jgi:hypothetical protein
MKDCQHLPLLRVTKAHKYPAEKTYALYNSILVPSINKGLSGHINFSGKYNCRVGNNFTPGSANWFLKDMAQYFPIQFE